MGSFQKIKNLVYVKNPKSYFSENNNFLNKMGAAAAKGVRNKETSRICRYTKEWSFFYWHNFFENRKKIVFDKNY